MNEFVVEIPEELEIGFKEIGRNEVNNIICNALREHLSERLMFKLSGELLKDSKITDDIALEWGDELKERVAKRHGL